MDFVLIFFMLPIEGWWGVAFYPAGLQFIKIPIFILSISLTMKVGKATEIRQDKKPNPPQQS